MICQLRLLALFLLSALWIPAATAHEVAVVLSQHGGAYQSFAEALSALGERGGHRIVLAGTPNDGLDQQAINRAAVVVAAGSPALEAVLQGSSRPTVAVMIARNQFETIRQRNPEATVSAIVLDQPAERQLALVRTVLPDATRVGVLFGPATATLESALEGAAANAGVRLVGQRLTTANDLPQALERVLRSADVLIALPDPLVSSPTAARAILLGSYRYQRPVFAYSQAYVDAGALAAVFSTPADIAAELVAWLDGSTTPLRLPAVRAPRSFDIAINRQVARALNLDIGDETALLDALRAGERP